MTTFMAIDPSTGHEFGKNDDDWTSQAWPPALANERLLLQAAYTDQLIGDLMQRLQATGLWDRAVVVLAADHGIAFTPGEPARGLGTRPVPESLYPQMLCAPLFVKAPRQTVGKTSDANVMTIDILPTIAELDARARKRAAFTGGVTTESIVEAIREVRDS